MRLGIRPHLPTKFKLPPEHLLAAVDGKPKEVFGGTYSQIKEVLGKIHESGYFDQSQVYEGYVEADIVIEQEPVPVEPVLNHEVVSSQEQPPPLPHTMPLIETLTIEARPAVHPQQPPLEQQPPSSHHSHLNRYISSKYLRSPSLSLNRNLNPLGR
ncbi:hypothetical protein NQ318_004996 [Aromia moschata]|uniref:Caprin-1 dimerization domain-containing protein n=1 Tax=Aromia moschata TaxID=1265417 RepID=A0AAV8Y965_9CUCU|nr:hypothetical protein NQ318_004996 [Aromia moschata]